MDKGTSIYREIEREQNKEQRKNEIISIAKKMFIEKGYNKSTMSDIAKEAKISRKTLYRYYNSKEEIALEIEISAFKVYIEYQKDVLKNLKGNGFNKLSTYLKNMDNIIDDFKELIVFTGFFDNYFIDDYPETNATKEFIELIETSNKPINELIEEGMEDGSIRNDINSLYVANTISNSILAMSQRVYTRYQHLNDEQHIDARKMISCQIELFLNGIKQ
jgi:AcrR family transcriptional regulator